MTETNQEFNNTILPNTPVSPKKKSPTKAIIFVVLVLIIILAGISVVLVYKNKTSKPSGQANPSITIVKKTDTSTSTAPTRAKERQAIDGLSGLSVASDSPVDLSTLPAELASLVLSDASATAISKVTFTDGSHGYKIVYTEKSNVPSLFQKIFTVSSMPDKTTNKSNFSFVFMTSTSLAATLGEQSSSYLVKIDVNSFSADTSKVIIIAVAKN